MEAKRSYWAQLWQEEGRNLGQLAAYFLQTGAVQEADDFYLQAL